MKDKIITMLYPYNIGNAWHEIEPMMQKVLSVMDTHTTEDIRKSLISGQSQLWVQWNDGIDAFIVTEFVPYPKGTWLRIWLMSAKSEKEILWDKLKKEIMDFSDINNCLGIEIIGREGWEKRYPEAQKHSVVLRLPSMRIH